MVMSLQNELDIGGSGPFPMTASDVLAQNARNMYYEDIGLRNQGSFYGIRNFDRESLSVETAPYQPYTGAAATDFFPAPSDTTVSSATTIPSIDEARSIVRQFYLNVLGREPDESGWNFWSTSFINEIQNKGISFNDAMENLRTAFNRAVGADYEKPYHPISLLDAYNNTFAGAGGAPKSASGDFVVVPQATESSGNTRLIVILALVGIAATIGIYYWQKHHG